MTKNQENADREIVIQRIFDVPPELVWQAWMDPLQLAKWWGPTGFTITTYQMDFKVEGVWQFVMHGPDGTDYKDRIIYKEIEKPTHLLYTHDSGHDDDPEQFETLVTFEDKQGKTKVTMRALFKSAKVRKEVIEKHDALEGGRQTFERLAIYLNDLL